MASDFDTIAANPPGGEQPDPRFGQELQQSLGNMRDFQSRLATQNAASEVPPQPTKVTTKTSPDGKKTVAIEGDASLAEYYGKAGQFYQQALGGFAKQLSQIEQQTAMREQQAREHPWAQLATALSANLAQQKDMPGWVRGLGQTAAQLNPTADQLRNQRLGMIQQETSLAEKGAGLSIAEARTNQASVMERQRAEQARSRDLLTVERDAGIAARKEGSFDKDLYIKQRLAMGDSPETAMASAQRLEGVANDQKLLMAQKEKDAVTRDAAKRQDEIDKEIRMQDFFWKKNAAAEKLKEARDLAKEAAAAKKDAEKRQSLGAVTEAKVEDILTAKRSTNKMLEIFDPNTTNPDYKHFQDIVGPLRGRETDMQKWLGTLNEKDAQLVAKINLQFANAVKTLGAGSYGYRISERGFLQSFTEALKNGAAQNYGNLKAWSEFYNIKIDALKDIKDQYDWSHVDAIMNTPPGQPFPDSKKTASKTKEADPLGIR